MSVHTVHTLARKLHCALYQILIERVASDLMRFLAFEIGAIMSAYRRSGLFTSIMALLFIAFNGVAIVSYALGWLTIDQHPEQTTIQVDMQAVKRAATEVKQEGKELLEKTGEALQESGRALEENVERSESPRDPASI